MPNWTSKGLSYTRPSYIDRGLPFRSHTVGTTRYAPHHTTALQLLGWCDGDAATLLCVAVVVVSVVVYRDVCYAAEVAVCSFAVVVAPSQVGQVARNVVAL